MTTRIDQAEREHLQRVFQLSEAMRYQMAGEGYSDSSYLEIVCQFMEADGFPKRLLTEYAVELLEFDRRGHAPGLLEGLVRREVARQIRCVRDDVARVAGDLDSHVRAHERTTRPDRPERPDLPDQVKADGPWPWQTYQGGLDRARNDGDGGDHGNG